ncbi:MAG: SPOR domain-containing protein [Candidatus Sedimenticola endophacoides]
MRWLFLLLVLVNLAIYLWGGQIQAPTEQSAVVIEPAVGELRLLSEAGDVAHSPARSTEVAAVAVEPQAPANLPAAPPDETHTDQVMPEKSPTAAVTPEPAGKEGTQREVVPAQAEALPHADLEQTAVAETAARGGADFVVPAPAPGEPTSTPNAETLAPAAPVAQAEQPYCGTLGPVETRTQAQSLSVELIADGMDATVRQRGVQRTTGYWVMLPPFASREAAIARFDSIKATGINDMKRFVQGRYRNGISFGLFSQQENALNRQRALKARGIDVVLVSRSVEADEYYVDFEAVGATFAQVQEKLNKRYPQRKITEQACPHIVSR